MDQFSKIITLSIAAALGTAVVLNANKVAPLMKNAGDAWVGVLKTISGQVA